MNRREFFALTAGAALGGIVAGAVANTLAPPRAPMVPACLEMRPQLEGNSTAMFDAKPHEHKYSFLFTDVPKRGFVEI